MRKRNFDDYSKFINELDPELKQILFGINSPNKSKSKKKKKSSKFKIGDSIVVNDKYGTIILGPYQDSYGADVYEIELEDGSIITAEEEKISIYIPPVEEEKDEDDDF